MKTYDRIVFALLGSLLLAAGTTLAVPNGTPRHMKALEPEPDIVGDVEPGVPSSHKTLQDTVWIADWTFDSGTPCSDIGWTPLDGHDVNDGVHYWHTETGYEEPSTGMTGIVAALGYHDNFCCIDKDGYENDWYQGIRMTYQGTAALSFAYIVDSEAGYDFLQIETDSACSSFDRVDWSVDPSGTSRSFRIIEASTGGLVIDGSYTNLALTDHGAGIHCVYIAFLADGAYSPCDGRQSTSIGEALLIDNIVLDDASGTRSEDFEDGILDIGTYLNMQEAAPFGNWARVYSHITDNDVCSENSTCAWLWSDNTTPTLFNDPSMSFGPGGYVVKNWLDDNIVSPWASLASTPTATGTMVSYRMFGGNTFPRSRIVHGAFVRSRATIDGEPCQSGWNLEGWYSISYYYWGTIVDEWSQLFDPTAEELQVRIQTTDWQYIAGASSPVPFVPGPGPYIDRVRIGRRILSGPVISEGLDVRTQAQDCFPTMINPAVTPAGGPKWMPSTDRFGACAWSQATELGINASSPNLITGDSIHVQVVGVRIGGDSITSVTFHGAIVRGPHAGKAPPPYTVGGNGFFSFDADSVRSSTGTILKDNYYVSLDDLYFRGGDEVHYFWAATDNGGGYTSDPVGLTAPPASIAEAQFATEGMLEVSYLPTINWDPAYIARIQADDHGDLNPLPEELANSTQANCILYVNLVNTRRRSGDVNRTSFMYTLDKLGYRASYDIYDQNGSGNINNQLGGRATIEQCQGYNVIVYDVGNYNPGRPILPDGIDLDGSKIDQGGFFRNWLAQASLSEAQYATLWFISSNVLEEKSGIASNAGVLLNTDMGVQLASSNQGLSANPDVVGVTSFVFDQGTGSASVNFTGDEFVLNGGCPVIRNYDGAQTSAGTATATHRYRSPTTSQLGDAAIVMNRNNAMAYNSILQTHPWFDIRDGAGTPSSSPPESELLGKVLGAALPPQCLKSPGPTDTGEEDELDVPARTALYQNVPNPFNPTTKIHYDLAQSGRVALRIYDVAGRLVRTLLDEDVKAGRNHSVLWNGLDDHNRRVSSGVYFYRLDAAGERLTKKMVVMK